jgi:hypothetical protein
MVHIPKYGINHTGQQENLPALAGWTPALSTAHAHPSHCQEICRGPLLSTKFLTGTPAASSIVT